MNTRAYFRSPLQLILQAELGRGNRIRDAGEWPPHCRMFVLLDRPFRHKHPLAPGVMFKKINDPHHGKAEYSFEVEPGLYENLACGF